MRYILQCRRCWEVNTDPQRRCYNGGHADYKIEWSNWYDVVSSEDQDDLEITKNNFQKINPTWQYRVRKLKMSKNELFDAIESIVPMDSSRWLCYEESLQTFLEGIQALPREELEGCIAQGNGLGQCGLVLHGLIIGLADQDRWDYFGRDADG